ncbi:MAG: SLAC1 anion channel family protein [Campylobacterales bacterium]|nr:SLAC1 anion channel family protein [Campylobacterales bacterium]
METKIEDLTRLNHFPIMMFAVIMGISGLAMVYLKFFEVFGISSIFAQGLIALDSIFFVAIAFTYGIKLLRYPNDVKKEFTHPIRINFFAAVSISLLLLSILYHHISITVATSFFYMGLVLQTYFTLNTIRYWIENNLEITHSNPAWFIPIVGNIIVPVAGSKIIPNFYLMFYFSIGLFFWLVLFTVIFYRIIFHHQLAQKFLPTLFILIAPPAVGFLAYIKLGYPLDFLGYILFSLGLFFTLLISFMYKSFLNLKFFISWWAFTFPMAAITAATAVMYSLTNDYFLYILSFILLAGTTFIVLFVGYKTVYHMLKKEICIAE